MDSLDDDMFALSDDDIPTLTPKCNPVEEHLMKKLSELQNRIEKTNGDIEEIRETTSRVLKSLHSQALYGADITSDSDSDLYTIDGQLVPKKIKQVSPWCTNKPLVIENTWKRILCDKCVIGVTLRKTSKETIRNPRFYIDVKDGGEFRGTSMFWCIEENQHWCNTNTIDSYKTVATVTFDLARYDRKSYGEIFGTISYEFDDKEYQTPVPIIRLRVEDAIDSSFGIKFSGEQDYLAIKSISVEKLVSIPLPGHPGRKMRVMEYLKTKGFTKIQDNSYVVQKPGNLTYCLVDVLPKPTDTVELRIFSRSTIQMSLMLGLLQNEFPDMSVKEDNNCVDAAMALIAELELYLHDGSTSEKQRARIKTDLLIP